MEQVNSLSAAAAPHIAILPSPGMGHLIPLIEFAKRIILRHPNFTFTFLIPTDGSAMKAQRSLLQSLQPPAISSVFLPQVTLFDDVSSSTTDLKIETIISLTIVRSLPHIRDAIADLMAANHRGRRLVALVVDLFATDGMDVAREFNLASYIFFPSSATNLSLFFYLPTLDSEVEKEKEFRDMGEPVRIPGAIPIPGSELLDPLQDRSHDAYKWMLHHAKRYRLADGVIVNSFMELEEGPIKALLSLQQPPVYPVGPIVSSSSDSSGCLAWLDRQPRGSVLYVSFGSGGTLSSKQMTELAMGLEMSGRRFLWVVKRPNDKAANATYFSVVHVSNKDSSSLSLLEEELLLPSGFLERTKDKGMVVPTWAPQAQILGHVATGGFLSHCGWNSTMESVVSGVPIIAWPLYAEQKTNAFMLTHDVKIALRVVAQEDGIISRDQISEAVESLFLEEEEGDNGGKTNKSSIIIRNRIKILKEAADAALVTSSTKAIDELALKWLGFANSLHGTTIPPAL